MNSFKLGIIAEYAVLLLYKICFYKILHHRYKSYVGEIDLIVARGKNLVFVEVKARKFGLYDGVVSNNQIDRIKNTAEFFLSRNPEYNKHNVRFDFALVRPYKFPIIIKNAW